MHDKRHHPTSKRAGCRCGGKVHKQEWAGKRTTRKGVPRRLHADPDLERG